MPIKPPEAEAADSKSGMTLDELTEWITSVTAAGTPGTALVEVTTVGLLKPRIKTAKVHTPSSK